MPGGRSFKRYSPVSSVTLTTGLISSLLVAVMVTPGRTAPDSSLIYPRRLPPPDCANTGDADSTRYTPNAKLAANLENMFGSFWTRILKRATPVVGARSVAQVPALVNRPSHVMIAPRIPEPTACRAPAVFDANRSYLMLRRGLGESRCRPSSARRQFILKVSPKNIALCIWWRGQKCSLVRTTGISFGRHRRA